MAWWLAWAALAQEPVETAPPDRYGILVDDRYGFIDRSGAVVIEPRFEGAARFSEGFARVMNDGKQGFVRPDGTWLVEPTYPSAGDFSEGRAGVWTDEEAGYVDTQGAFHSFPWFGDLVEGRVMVQDPNGVYGFLDPEGNQVPDKAFAFAQPFSEGLAVVSSTGEWMGLMDRDGNMVVPEKFKELGTVSEGYAQAAAADSDGPYQGLIDKTGTLVYRAPPGAVVGPVMAGVCVVHHDGGIRLVRPDGTTVASIDGARTRANDGFGDERLAVQRTTGDQAGRWGFVDSTGEWAVPPTFDDAAGFHDGLAAVRRGTLWGYVDQTGAEVWFQPEPSRPPAGDLAKLPGRTLAGHMAADTPTEVRAGRLLHTAPNLEDAISLARVTPGGEAIVSRGEVFGVFVWDAPVPLLQATAAATPEAGTVWLVEPDPVAENGWRSTWHVGHAVRASEASIQGVLQQVEGALATLEAETDNELELAAYGMQVLDEADRLIPQVFRVEPGQQARPMWRAVTPGEFQPPYE